MKKAYIALLLFLYPILVCGQSTNSFQPPQPSRNNFVQRTASAIPQASNIVFQHNIYDGTTTPQVGSLTFARSGGPITYGDTATTLAEAATDAQPIGYDFGQAETSKALLIHGNVTNYMTRSEDFSHANWVAIGGGTGTAGTADSPFTGVDTLADTITGGSSGDGLEQSSGQAAASTAYIGSVFLKSSSGTKNVDLVVSDNTVSEIGIVSCAANATTWTRCESAKLFSAAASGNAKLRIITGNQSIFAWGGQLERKPSSNRNRSMGAYVRTTAASASSGHTTYDIPNSIATQLSTKGTISLWARALFDNLDIRGGANASLFSLNNETLLGEQKSGSFGLGFWINGSQPTFSLNTFDVSTKHEFIHWTFTWDTDADSYKIYKNGAEINTSSTAKSAITIGSNALRIGTYEPLASNDVSFDAYYSQIIVWKTPLNAGEVASVYATKSADYLPTAPGTGKLFEVSLGTSPIPTTYANPQYWYENSDNQYWYHDTATTIKQAANGVLAPGYPLNSAVSKKGMQFTTTAGNIILQSEAPATTWSAVLLAVVNNSVATFGDMALGTILGVSGDGIQQSSAQACANEDLIGSVYVSVAAGTLDGRITIEGDSGGAPETTNTDFTATTTVQRVSVYKPASGACTGSAKLKVTLRAAGTLRLGGMMLERVSVPSDGTYPSYNVPTWYIKTTTAAVRATANKLIYPIKNHMNPSKGTILAWVNFFANGSEFMSPSFPVVLGIAGLDYSFMVGVKVGTLMSHVWRNDASFMDFSNTVTAFQWTRLVWTWSCPTATCTMKEYIDGSLVKTNTTSLAPVSARNIWIGQDGGQNGVHNSDDFFNGLIDNVQIWGDAVGDSAVTTDWNATKADYGR